MEGEDKMGNFSNGIKKFLSNKNTVTVVGAVVATSEVVTSISLEMVGGAMLYAVLLCLPGDTSPKDDCVELASKCVDEKVDYSIDCSACYRECMNDGRWPYYKCPLK